MGHYKLEVSAAFRDLAIGHAMPHRLDHALAYKLLDASCSQFVDAFANSAYSSFVRLFTPSATLCPIA